MSLARYLQLDVFCARAGGGNPLGVVIGADDWDGADMQRFAAWTNLVETTFVLKPTLSQASYRLRIFTPAKEIPFAGHPTIGSAHAVLETGYATARDDALLQECAAGLLPIRIEGADEQRRLFVQAPAARVVREGIHVEPILSYLLRGIALGALPPACVEGGRRWWVAEFASEAALRGWKPDHASIGTLARETDTLGLCAFARSAHADYDLVVRAFPGWRRHHRRSCVGRGERPDRGLDRTTRTARSARTRLSRQPGPRNRPRCIDHDPYRRLG